jgi:SpoVK/Ycf46/Vps4 family AAA+-type ATPase
MEPTTSLATTGEDRFEPQFARDKTMQWASDKQDRHQPASDSSTLAMTQNEARAEYRQESQSNQSNCIDLAELEFDWTVRSDVDFDHVGGMDDEKAELDKDVIKPLTTHRKKAVELGITPSNIIFHGPPGTGKTYLAKALATELGFPFVNLSGSDVQSKWINESSQKVQTLFEEAQAVAEETGGAVVFLDELDSVLKDRGAGRAHEEDTKVVNEFLSRLENTDEENIVFIGATNRLESLDEAGIRSGRIDKKIHIGMPGCESRASILKAQLADRPHCLMEDQIRTIAEQTDGMTAADLSSLVEAAARNSLYQRGDDKILQVDMHQALID